MKARLLSTCSLFSLMTFLAVPACSGGESAADAMKRADAEEESKKKPEGEKKPIPTSELPEPSAEELAAWDRKDPEGEKHLYKWDKANAKKMQTYWKELQCFREKMQKEGSAAVGTEPGGTEQVQWENFKLAFIPHVNGWQQRLFAAEGQELLSKSKYISNILEAHELVMNGYPTAYNDGDENEIKRQDALWTIVSNKVVDYSKKIGAPMDPLPDLEDPKAKEKWDKYCTEVLKPPDPKKKKKK